MFLNYGCRNVSLNRFEFYNGKTGKIIIIIISIFLQWKLLRMKAFSECKNQKSLEQLSNFNTILNIKFCQFRLIRDPQGVPNYLLNMSIFSTKSLIFDLKMSLDRAHQPKTMCLEVTPRSDSQYPRTNFQNLQQISWFLNGIQFFL